MKRNPHLLSVIVPTYNRAPYLEVALASVASQVYRPLEVIVVDDGSTDSTSDVASAFFRRTNLPGHYKYQPNHGPAAARNLGLSMASGEWIAFLDSDDLWLSSKTTLQMQILNAAYEAEAAWGGTVVFAGDTPPADTLVHADSPADRSPQLILLLQSMLFRRTAVERLGLFDEELRVGEDMEWMMRAATQPLKIVFHRDPVVFYRRHAASLTSDKEMVERTIISLAKRSLARRRSSAAAGMTETFPVTSPWISIQCPDA